MRAEAQLQPFAPPKGERWGTKYSVQGPYRVWDVQGVFDQMRQLQLRFNSKQIAPEEFLQQREMLLKQVGIGSIPNLTDRAIMQSISILRMA